MAAAASSLSTTTTFNLYLMRDETGTPSELDGNLKFFCAEKSEVLYFKKDFLTPDGPDEKFMLELGGPTYHMHYLNRIGSSTVEESSQQAMTNTSPKESSVEGSSTTGSEKFNWNSDDTKLLITLLQKYRKLLADRKLRNKIHMYKVISQELQERKCMVSSDQVESKIRSLERGYKDMIDNNKKTGRGKATCSFQT